MYGCSSSGHAGVHSSQRQQQGASRTAPLLCNKQQSVAGVRACSQAATACAHADAYLQESCVLSVSQPQDFALAFMLFVLQTRGQCLVSQQLNSFVLALMCRACAGASKARPASQQRAGASSRRQPGGSRWLQQQRLAWHVSSLPLNSSSSGRDICLTCCPPPSLLP